MGIRFRQYLKIAPGLKINIGKSGITGLTAGTRGLTFTMGKGGLYNNIGLVGTGISLRTKLAGGKKLGHAPSTPDEAAQYAEDHNDLMNSVVNIHKQTPMKPIALADIIPDEPKFQWVGTIVSLLLMIISLSTISASFIIPVIWIFVAIIINIDKISYITQKQDIEQRKAMYTNAQSGDIDACLELVYYVMKQEGMFFAEFQYEISINGNITQLSVVLPKSKDIPQARQVYIRTRKRIEEKPKKLEQIADEYATYASGVVVFTVGVVFASLSTITSVNVSAIDRIIDSETGMEKEVITNYTFSREDWCAINPQLADPQAICRNNKDI